MPLKTPSSLRLSFWSLLALCASLGLPLLAQAHHGWSSFDQGRPIWLEGRASKVAWRNPHAELKLELPADARLPTDLASRAVPASRSSASRMPGE